MSQFNISGDDSESDSHTFKIKAYQDGLRGSLHGQYQVLVRILDESQIALSEGETTIIEAEVSTPIYDVEGNLQWLFIKCVSECFDSDSTQEINTNNLPSDNQFDDHTGETVHRKPPSQSPKQKSIIKNCSRCQKVTATDQLKNGLCIYCRNKNASSTWNEYDTAY